MKKIIIKQNKITIIYTNDMFLWYVNNIIKIFNLKLILSNILKLKREENWGKILKTVKIKT